MSLRINQVSMKLQTEAGVVGAAPPPAPSGAPDGWATRLAKLVPAEALGLYGAAAGMVPQASAQLTAGQRQLSLQVIALVCLAFSAAIRIKGTAGEDGKPQFAAVAIALISFLIWLVALGPGNAPFPLPAGLSFAAPIVAVLWATIVSFFYKGDPPKA